jgi:hypothetical protein
LPIGLGQWLPRVVDDDDLEIVAANAWLSTLSTARVSVGRATVGIIVEQNIGM